LKKAPQPYRKKISDLAKRKTKLLGKEEGKEMKRTEQKLSFAENTPPDLTSFQGRGSVA